MDFKDLLSPFAVSIKIPKTHFAYPHLLLFTAAWPTIASLQFSLLRSYFMQPLPKLSLFLFFTKCVSRFRHLS